MPNPLDPIWNAHRITLDAYGVVRRALVLGPAERAAALQGGQFAGPATDAQVADLLDAAEDALDEQTVMFLFATFEATLRDHIAAQAPLLATVAAPGPHFGPDLQHWFEEVVKRAYLDGVVGLFVPSAGPALVRLANAIKVYRHWLAHGKRTAAPPTVAPNSAYATLTSFLQLCNLA
jgi:hypothetical protein